MAIYMLYTSPPKKKTFKNKNSIILCPENLSIGDFKKNLLICLIVIISRQYNSQIVISTCSLHLLRFREKHRWSKMIKKCEISLRNELKLKARCRKSGFGY